MMDDQFRVWLEERGRHKGHSIDSVMSRCHRIEKELCVSLDDECASTDRSEALLGKVCYRWSSSATLSCLLTSARRYRDVIVSRGL